MLLFFCTSHNLPFVKWFIAFLDSPDSQTFFGLKRKTTDEQNFEQVYSSTKNYEKMYVVSPQMTQSIHPLNNFFEGFASRNHGVSPWNEPPSSPWWIAIRLFGRAPRQTQKLSFPFHSYAVLCFTSERSCFFSFFSLKYFHLQCLVFH